MRHSQLFPSKWHAGLKIVLIYALFASTWILLSDRVLFLIEDEPEKIARLSTLKGGLFVAVTSLLLYVLLSRYWRNYAQALAARLDTLKLIETITDSAEDAIYARDLAGRYLIFNRAASRLFDKPKEEVIGRASYLLNVRGAEDLLWEKSRREGTEPWIQTVREVVNTLDGEKNLLVTRGALRDEEGKIVGTFGIARDISELRKAEQALEESEARFNLFMDTLPGAVFIKKSEDGTLLYCNRFMENVLGRRDWSGKTIRELFPAAIVDKMQQDDREVLAAGYRVNEEWAPNIAGQLRLYEVHKFRIERKEATPLLGGIAIDITERKETELALVTAKEAAESANLAKSKFLAASSHDLRQPLMAINLFLDALLRTPLSQEQVRFAGQLKYSVQSLGEMLNTLLSIAHLDSGVVETALSAVRSGLVFEWVESEFAAMFLDKGLRFKLHFPLCDLSFFTDAALLKSMLRNILDNALKFCERGGVLVGVRRRGKRALIQVWDTGRGIGPEHVGHVFDEYFQVGNRERDRNKGVGLGLSIVMRQARLIGAEVRCRSRLGKGSVFEIDLPLTDMRMGHPLEWSVAAVERDLDLSQFSGRHIVVIEDDLQVGKAMSELLETLGLKVALFGSAESALAYAEIAQADFYVSDFRLPGEMNGLTLLRAIERQGNRPVKAVLMTGDTAPEHDELFRASPWPVLIKPVQASKLLATLVNPQQSSAGDSGAAL